jgi:hypothetical protein
LDGEEDEAVTDLRYQIEELKEELNNEKDNYEETLDRFCELEDEKVSFVGHNGACGAACGIVTQHLRAGHY